MTAPTATPAPTSAPTATPAPIHEEKKKDDNYQSSTAYGFVMFIVIILWLWFIAGLLAFIVSLVCFGFNGSISDKFLGLIVSLVVGPFYWFYFIFNNNYCTMRPLE